jgi:hypothetical protein
MTTAANPLSIRERAVLAEHERARHAKLALAPHDTEHEINVLIHSGSSLDDHRIESGFCPVCKLFVNRSFDLATGGVEDSISTVEQRVILADIGQREGYFGLCTECEELALPDDFDAKAKTCHECQRKQAIESGEAFAEWKQWRDE